MAVPVTEANSNKIEEPKTRAFYNSEAKEPPHMKKGKGAGLYSLSGAFVLFFPCV